VTALVVLAGAAGTGKSTLGAVLAVRIGAALLDFDTLTEPLAVALLGGRALGTPHEREVVRPLRYATLTAVALEVLGCGVGVVAAAPWTRELEDGAWLAHLTSQVGERGGRLVVAHLRCDEPVRLARVARRGAARDAGRPPPAPAPRPAVAHLHLDTTDLGPAGRARCVEALVAAVEVRPANG